MCDTCNPTLCSDFDGLLAETVSQTRYLMRVRRLAISIFQGMVRTVYAAGRFERSLMVINMGII